ncbi:TPA: MBL fold metallo-hydrolase, partial [Candidatus Micrarchaeota archaeon]|nr:MBL fold metallo-hydrolase [Candidatus Micrarchaeota archaeon]
MESLKFIPLGGAGEVGRSSYLVEWGESMVLDSGLDMDDGRLPIFDRIRSDVKAIAISHPHGDHVGSLPILWSRVRATIVSTEATKVLSLLMLKRIYRKYGDYLSTIREMEDSWVAIDDNSSLELDGDIAIELHDAAHTFGSSQILVDLGGYRLLYTGDLYTGESIFGSFHGWDDLNIDDVILEGTDITQNDMFDSEMSRMISDLAGKTDEKFLSLIPVNSLGHGPEVMYFISKAVEDGVIGTENLYSIGAINRVIGILHEKGMYKDVTETIMRNFEMLEDYRDALDVAKNTRPAILVSTPGKPLGGFSGNLISAINGDEKAVVVLVEHKA